MLVWRKRGEWTGSFRARRKCGSESAHVASPRRGVVGGGVDQGTPFCRRLGVGRGLRILLSGPTSISRQLNVDILGAGLGSVQVREPQHSCASSSVLALSLPCISTREIGVKQPCVPALRRYNSCVIRSALLARAASSGMECGPRGREDCNARRSRHSAPQFLLWRELRLRARFGQDV